MACLILYVLRKLPQLVSIKIGVIVGRQYDLLDNQHHVSSTALPHNVKLKITITEPAITTFALLGLLLLFPQKVREREQ